MQGPRERRFATGPSTLPRPTPAAPAFRHGLEKIAKCAYMLFHSQIGDIAAVARKNFRLRYSAIMTFFVRIAEKKFTWFDRWARSGV